MSSSRHEHWHITSVSMFVSVFLDSTVFPIHFTLSDLRGHAHYETMLAEQEMILYNTNNKKEHFKQLLHTIIRG